MELVTKMFICARESVVRSKRGQTMTEYALHHRGMRMAIQKTHERLEVCLSETATRRITARLFSCARTFWARSSAFARGFSPSNVR